MCPEINPLNINTSDLCYYVWFPPLERSSQELTTPLPTTHSHCFGSLSIQDNHIVFIQPIEFYGMVRFYRSNHDVQQMFWVNSNSYNVFASMSRLVQRQQPNTSCPGGSKYTVPLVVSGATKPATLSQLKRLYNQYGVPFEQCSQPCDIPFAPGQLVENGMHGRVEDHDVP